MTVYVIKRGGEAGGLHKIGFTMDLEQRINGFSTSTPEGFETVRAFKGGMDLEARLHKTFESRRVAGEWFRLSEQDIETIVDMPDEENPASGRVTPTPRPEDEFSESIVLETRFYLNELVKREWRGMGDTIEQARDRIMVTCGLDPSYGFRLWGKPQEMQGVSGEAYRCLQLYYIMKMREEGKLTQSHERTLKTLKHTYQNILLPEKVMEDAFGVAFILGLIREDAAQGEGMDSPKN